MNARIIPVRMAVLVLIPLLEATRVNVLRATKETIAGKVGLILKFLIAFETVH